MGYPNFIGFNILLLSLTAFNFRPIHGAVECSEGLDVVCQDLLHPQSRCINGFCSNPFQEGCLKAYGVIEEKRICNSHDPPEAVGVLCEPTSDILDYNELRILSQDWDSPMLTSWVMQIVLSELVRVPVSIESSGPGLNLNFYDPGLSFDYGGVTYDYDALQRGKDLVDCRITDEPCAHVIPEAWNGQNENIFRYEDEGLIENAVSAGGVAKYSWFMPRFLAETEHRLLSHFGLRGEEARRKLASIFNRPTTWKDYCEQVSTNNCTIPDNTTARAPETQAENAQYFSEGLFTGHFRPTEDNDCDANPTTCTGHITNVVCSWSTFVVPQAYYADIHVKSNGPTISGGYPFQSMVEIWRAANATRSPVLHYWFQPDMLLQEFLGTDWEFQEVLMPIPTQECATSRVSEEERCSADFETQLGLKEGSCDSESHSYQKLIVSNLWEETNAVPPAERSPAYEAIKNFRISDLQMNDMFRYWIARKTDTWGYDPHEAACRWVVENVEDLRRFVPRTYPRTAESSDGYHTPLMYAAIAVGVSAGIVVVLTGVGVFYYRNRRIMRTAQVEFGLMLLFGLLLVSIGAVLVAVEPSHVSCVLQSWFITLGYTLELVPLIVKVAAINTLMAASRRMKRVQLSKTTLFGSVLGVLVLVVIFMVLWTIMDPYTAQQELVLTNEQNEQGGTIVSVGAYCGSSSDAWLYTSVAWQVLLLIAATVLAFQTRNVVSEFNESRLLAFMIYSHFVFVCLRIITILLVSTLPADQVAAFRSFVYSLDTIFTIIIYFVPKFVALSSPTDTQRGSMIYMPTNALQRVIAKMSRSLHHSSAAPDQSEHATDEPEDVRFGSPRIPSVLRDHSSLAPVDEDDRRSDNSDKESADNLQFSSGETHRSEENA